MTRDRQLGLGNTSTSGCEPADRRWLSCGKHRAAAAWHLRFSSWRPRAPPTPVPHR